MLHLYHVTGAFVGPLAAGALIDAVGFPNAAAIFAAPSAAAIVVASCSAIFNFFRNHSRRGDYRNLDNANDSSSEGSDNREDSVNTDCATKSSDNCDSKERRTSTVRSDGESEDI